MKKYKQRAKKLIILTTNNKEQMKNASNSPDGEALVS